MIRKCLPMLLLCSVPLIAMERELNPNDQERKEAIKIEMEEFKKDLKDSVCSGDFISSERVIKHIQNGKELALLSSIYIAGPTEFDPSTELAPSQVSPCLDTLEQCLKQPDNILRDCIRKYVELCRGN
jgi:hypothetical protein